MSNNPCLVLACCVSLLAACDGSNSSDTPDETDSPDEPCCADASSTGSAANDAHAPAPVESPTESPGPDSGASTPSEPEAPHAAGDASVVEPSPGEEQPAPPDGSDAATVLDAGQQEGTDDPSSGDPDAATPSVDSGSLECDAPAACGLVECAVPQIYGIHVAACTELAPHSNPPTSGAHYPSWAAFGIYDEPINPGYFLHTLEHSAVALLYNCDELPADAGSCDELIDSLLDFYAAYPDDPLCSDVPHRLVIAPDPNLDSAFAAVAWGYHLKGDCFDAERVRAFVEAHYGMNYEDLCNPGIDPSGLCE